MEGSISRTMNVLREVHQERVCQDSKWGVQNHPSLDQVLLGRPGGCSPERMAEEYEICSENRAKFLCEQAFQSGRGTYGHIAIEEMAEVICARDEQSIRAELIQLAAVCVAWVEAIDRRSANANAE